VRRPGLRGLAAAYRVTWCTVAALVCAAGFACGCVFLGSFAAVCLAAVGAVLGAVTAVPQPGPPPLQQARVGQTRRAVVAGLLGAVLPLAVIGLLAVLGGPAVLLCLLVVAGGIPLWPLAGPPVRVRLPGAGASGPVAGSPSVETIPPDVLPAVAALPGLTTAELCRVWQRSYLRVQRSTWPGEREHLAQLRRACLDELERRDPRAFARWLAGARAAGDPGRFFGRQQSSS
jgi:hypothetical protein